MSIYRTIGPTLVFLLAVTLIEMSFKFGICITENRYVRAVKNKFSYVYKKIIYKAIFHESFRLTSIKPLMISVYRWQSVILKDINPY